MLNGRRSSLRCRAALAVAAASVVLLALLALAGCGDDGGGAGSGDADVAPLTFIVPTRAGSFLGSGERLELVLRGVAPSAALGAEASGGGGSAGAVATPILFRRGDGLLGPDPLRATLTGAEVIPQRYDLELSEPRYDGVREELRFSARVLAGGPERPPVSFGAATLTLLSSLPTALLRGTVVEDDPRSPGGGDHPPVEGALIEVRAGKLGLVTARSEADGSFDAGPLPQGSYEVEATLSGFARDSATVQLPADGDDPELGLVRLENEIGSGP